MISMTRKGVNAMAGVALALLCAAAFIPSASAQTYYYPQYYYPYATASYTNAAEIQHLLDQVYALLSQLQALQAQSGYSYYTPGKVKTYTHTYNPSSKSYDVEVDTTDVDVEGDDSATFSGEIELDDASYAYVWFDYGQDGDLDESTDEEKIEDDGDFEIDVDDLDENERYFVRAVAEDPSGALSYGDILAFTTGDEDEDNDDDNDDDHNDDDIPEATTEDAEDVDEDSAELHGEIEMNDFEDGLAFFVYGEDEDAVEEVEDEDTYGDIDEDGDDLEKFSLTSNLDDTRTFWSTISGLDEDTEYFFRICVEYEDEDGDDTLQCGDVESFTTDED